MPEEEKEEEEEEINLQIHEGKCYKICRLSSCSLSLS
jgi:hypothetical protein